MKTQEQTTEPLQNLLPDEMLPVKKDQLDLPLEVQRAITLLEGATDLQVAQTGGIMLSDLAFTNPGETFGTPAELGATIRPAVLHLLKTKGAALVRDTFCRNDELGLFHIACRMAVVLSWTARKD